MKSSASIPPPTIRSPFSSTLSWLHSMVAVVAPGPMPSQTGAGIQPTAPA